MMAGKREEWDVAEKAVYGWCVVKGYDVLAPYLTETRARQIAREHNLHPRLVDGLVQLRKIGIERMDGTVMHLATAPQGCDCITHRAQAELLVARDLLAERRRRTEHEQ